MFSNYKKESIEWAGDTLSIETGKLARQADGAIVVTHGNTSVIATVVFSKRSNPDVDFLPLSVSYQEKFYAVGRVPGNFFKREGRPSEKEILTSRLIDRPIRPLFPKGFNNEIQVILSVLSYDGKNEPDVLAMIGASAALSISGVPFQQPIAGVRVSLDSAGKYQVNSKDLDKLDLVVAGTKDSILMVESQAQELTEKQMLEAVLFGHKQMQPVIKLIEKVKSSCSKPAWEADEKSATADTALPKEVMESMKSKILPAMEEFDRYKRKDKLKLAKEEIIETFFPEGSSSEEKGFDQKTLSSAFEDLYHKLLRQRVVSKKIRPDGRKPDAIRDIECETDLISQTHGSALFTRGETQALAVTTLGTGEDEQLVDGLEPNYKEGFMLHYNFPAFSVGEINNRMSLSRREVGHGKLAWRAISPVLPSKEDFAYTIRVVSEILESNGSSSMATVCGSSMSLMDAGVPIKSAVSGIAMGLIKEGDDFVVLSDIAGEEDHCGDMDFKVAGTSKGVTALQMDIKIDGVSEQIMKVALEQAHEGRAHILSKMDKAVKQARDDVKDSAPQMKIITVPKDKIREVIGSGGKVIREICETSGAKIDLEDDGSCRVSAVSGESLDSAMKMIKAITDEPEPGQTYDGTVVKIAEFGAFVNFFGARDGLVHISRITKEERVKKVEDYLKESQKVRVKLEEIDNRGKFKLTMIDVDQP